VLSVAISTGLPVWQAFGTAFEIEGQRSTNPSDRPAARFNMVTPGYFETLGIRITRGRAFDEHDREGSLPVAIVSERLVRQFFPKVDPLTQRLIIRRFGPDESAPEVVWQIVGVSADIRNAGPRETQRREIYVPFWQSPWPSVKVAVRTAAAPGEVQQSLAAVIRSLDPDLPMADVKTMEQRVSESLGHDRFNTVLFGSFAGVALLLAALGIYGVMSFIVAQRTHEIGLRMALGADRQRVLRDIVRDGMTTALAGTVVGSAGAYFMIRSMKGMVYGVEALGPSVFIVVAITLLGSAFLACAVPARRAASVNPMVALRQE
jgi:putative ABC transport system permease protein